MKVVLSNERGDTVSLEYDIRPTETAQLWASCVARSRSSGLRERDLFYNFPGHESSSMDTLAAQMEDVLSRLRVLYPDLTFPPVDRASVQEWVNRVHERFADAHRIHHSVRPEALKDWDRFNVLLHAMESTERAERFERGTGLHPAKIIFTWNEGVFEEIPERSFGEFSLHHEFGLAFINYAHIGRHFAEMFFAGDDDIPDGHIQPARRISGDTHLWFGPTNGHETVRSQMNRLREWFEARSERFGRLGYRWGDPKLSLGQIPVARLKAPLYSAAEIAPFVERISKMNRVNDVVVR